MHTGPFLIKFVINYELGLKYEIFFVSTLIGVLTTGKLTHSKDCCKRFSAVEFVD